VGRIPWLATIVAGLAFGAALVLLLYPYSEYAWLWEEVGPPIPPCAFPYGEIALLFALGGGALGWGLGRLGPLGLAPCAAAAMIVAAIVHLERTDGFIADWFVAVEGLPHPTLVLVAAGVTSALGWFVGALCHRALGRATCPAAASSA
jgi:hypothetical protein